MAYDTVEEFVSKANWEGGLSVAMNDYGLTIEGDLSDEAKEANPQFVQLWDDAAQANRALQVFIDANYEIDEM